MDSRSTPQGIGRGHPSDQGFDRGVDGRVARRATPGKRGPVAAKAASLPAQHSGGGHDEEGPPPSGAYTWKTKPKKANGPLWSLAGSPPPSYRRGRAHREGFSGARGGV